MVVYGFQESYGPICIPTLKTWRARGH
jgi:hypothetical protein